MSVASCFIFHGDLYFIDDCGDLWHIFSAPDGHGWIIELIRKGAL